METAEAISAIRNNWPDERYTMLREALTKAIAALEAMEAGQPDVQQLKPKMPLLEEVYNAIPFPPKECDQAMFIAGIAEGYKYISRHFGH